MNLQLSNYEIASHYIGIYQEQLLLKSSFPFNLFTNIELKNEKKLWRQHQKREITFLKSRQK